jgi:hypothetical protein
MLRVWGCTAYVLIQKDKRLLGTLGPHMEKCIFIGYPQGYKAWKFYNPETKKVIISERADFNEQFFLNKRHSSPQLPPPHLNSLVEPSPPLTYLPDTIDDADDSHHPSQQPVPGGDGSVLSELPPPRPESPASPSLFQTAPTLSSPTASAPATAPVTDPVPSRPQRQRRSRDEWLSEQ